MRSAFRDTSDKEALRMQMRRTVATQVKQKAVGRRHIHTCRARGRRGERCGEISVTSRVGVIEGAYLCVEGGAHFCCCRGLAETVAGSLQQAATSSNSLVGTLTVFCLHFPYRYNTLHHSFRRLERVHTAGEVQRLRPPWRARCGTGHRRGTVFVSNNATSNSYCWWSRRESPAGD